MHVQMPWALANLVVEMLTVYGLLLRLLLHQRLVWYVVPCFQWLFNYLLSLSEFSFSAFILCGQLWSQSVVPAGWPLSCVCIVRFL